MAAMSTFAAPRPLDPEGLASHMERLTRFARHLCGRHGDAEDLVQDTFERVLRRPRVVTGSEAAYLVQAVRNTHLSRLRSASSRVRTTAMPEDFEAVDHGAEDRPISARRAREVLQAVAALPKGFREAVVLVDVHGYRAGDAARELGIAEGTLHSRLFRGRAQVARACGA
jgi:RNA polymerase sigma-70 factor (ECF subfamily)